MSGNGSSYCLDVESFIRQVHHFPEIWDKRCDANRHHNKKNLAWAKIAAVFIEDFEDLPNIEKLDVYRKLHNKWRNIRDTYVRTLKRESRGEHKKYMYSQHLKFLNAIYPQAGEADEEESWEPPAKLGRAEAPAPQWPEPPHEPDVGLEFVDSLQQPAQDEDRSFFESLLPAIRHFDTDQKLDFRSQVIYLVKQIRSGDKKEGILKQILSDPSE